MWYLTVYSGTTFADYDTELFSMPVGIIWTPKSSSNVTTVLFSRTAAEPVTVMTCFFFSFLTTSMFSMIFPLHTSFCLPAGTFVNSWIFFNKVSKLSSGASLTLNFCFPNFFCYQGFEKVNGLRGKCSDLRPLPPLMGKYLPVMD